jgi:hypothetical protein
LPPAVVLIGSSISASSGEGEDGARLLVALADAAAAVESIVAGLEAAIARFVAGVAK